MLGSSEAADVVKVGGAEDTPLEAALAEWVEAAGRNTFMEISVPDAALKLVQARNPEWVNRLFFAKYDPEATWLDDLKPAFGAGSFFFDD